MTPTHFDTDAERRSRGEAALWRTLGRLVSRRRLIVGVTTVAAVASIIISLLLPNWYRASARLLLPEGGAGFGAAFLRNLPSAASSFLGGRGGGDYLRYQSILTSRSAMAAAVDSFELVRIYDVEDSQAPVQAAIEQLRSNTEFRIDMEFEFLEVAAFDKDPRRAADIANFFVRTLNEVNARLATQDASNFRQYIEARYFEALAAMDSLLDATVSFQKEHGIYDLPAQTSGFFEQVRQLRAQALSAEIQFDVASSRLGPDNSEVRALSELARAANRKYEEALEGSERLLPIAQSDVPDVARTYAELELEQTIQAVILEILGPMYEQARLQQEQKTEAVQVLDYAIPPDLKARPTRSIIVVLSTLTGFLLAVVYVLVHSWLAENFQHLLGRLQEELSRGVERGEI